MDANRQRFWMIAASAAWAGGERVRYDARHGVLRLASERERAVEENEARAAELLGVRRRAVDAFGTWAMWRDAPAEPPVPPPPAELAPPGLFVGGAAPGEQRRLQTAEPPTDFCVGFDGVLYLAVGGQVLLHDLRGRWPDHPVSAADFSAVRLAAHPEGGVWALDPGRRALARLVGLPLPTRPYAPDGSMFRPEAEDRSPPRMSVRAVLPEGPDPKALAVSPAGRVGVLCWRAAGEPAVLVRLDDAHQPVQPIILLGTERPYSLAWLAEDRVAVLLTGLGEARAYAVEAPLDAPAPDEQHPLGDIYPLQQAADADTEPFAHGVDLPPRYIDGQGRLRRLHRLSARSLARAGEAGWARLDSRDPRSVWHRLYVEASLPEGTALTVHLATSDDGTAPPEASEAWHPHHFGGPAEPGAPRAAWVSQPSELPFHTGLLRCPAERDRAGLFTVLVQRRGLRSSRLRGRFLHVRMALTGDGRRTPEVAALRAYASRFSYPDQYLPELYREHALGRDADRRGPPTQADFLERFLANFEGVLTTLEDRVANAHLLTHPAVTPAESLDWLASWVGMDVDPALPLDRRRALVEAANRLHRWRGTLRGLQLALDLATGGGVAEGRVVVVEDWRLRRTFATILGADLADESDELIAGLAVSGNSFVGDTLVLGQEHRRELLALFDADLDLRGFEEAAIERFFDRFAHRLTVLVHREEGPDLLGLVRRVVEREAPAHLSARVVAARHPLVVGLYSLVGVDTWLGRKPPRRSARVGEARFDDWDFLTRPPSLDPRLEGGAR